LLESQGILDHSQLQTFEPDPDERAMRLAERDALIARILAPMTAQSDSPAPPFEPA
jgi:hypothetical protein